MKIELIELSEGNLDQCFDLKVAREQTQYIASNADSWNTSKENIDVALITFDCRPKKQM